MADELTITCRICYQKDGTIVMEENNNLQRDVAGTLLTNTRQEIGTSEEQIDLSGLTLGGYFYAVNRDDTNWVELRGEPGGAPLVRLLPGDQALFRTSPVVTSDPQAIANAAPVELEFWLFSE